MKLFLISLLLTCSFLFSKGEDHLRKMILVEKNLSDTLTFDSLVHKNVFKVIDGDFTGKGWNLLVDEINKAQFVLIGEQHGEAEIPFFTGKVAEILKPKALIVELDPYTAAELSKASKDPVLYHAVLNKNPYAFAFYSWQQEIDLISGLRQRNIAIWGVNEINFLSMETFFTTLAANAKTPGNKRSALQLAEQVGRNDSPLFQTGDFGKFSAFHLKESTVDSLNAKFANESPNCRKMLADLKLSIPVFSNTSYQQRVNLMKKNLLNYVYHGISSDVIEMPKLLFKMGANHLTRTNDLTNNFEVGNLADDLAGAANKNTLHILVFGKKGTINSMSVADNKKAIKPYDVLKDKDLQMFGQFTEPVKDGEWAVYDLRPIRKAIRQGKYKVNNTSLLSFVMGYDLLVTFGQVNGSRFVE
jgi:hypothetical protein